MRLATPTVCSTQGRYPEENISWTTCMDYEDDTVGLHDYDRDHLTDCFEKPVPAPTALTAECNNHAIP